MAVTLEVSMTAATIDDLVILLGHMSFRIDGGNTSGEGWSISGEEDEDEPDDEYGREEEEEGDA